MTQGTPDYWRQLVSHVVLNRELGIEFASLATDGVILRLRHSSAVTDAPDDDCVHTAAIAAMVDAALGFSVHWAMPDDRSLVTLNIRIDHLARPRPRSDVLCHAVCHKVEPHVAFTTGKIYHADASQPFALAVGTIMFITADSWITRAEGGAK
jgi:acyl-coenzyme A thioesterase PaaI-like protein